MLTTQLMTFQAVSKSQAKSKIKIIKGLDGAVARSLDHSRLMYGGPKTKPPD